MRIIYNLDWLGHISVPFHRSNILKLQDLITHRTMLYEANNHCLESRVQAFFNQRQPYTSMIPDNVNYFMLRKNRIPPTDFCQLHSELALWVFDYLWGNPNRFE